MVKLEHKVSALIKEHGLQALFSSLIDNFDGRADFAHLSGDRKEENDCRKVAVVLFEALRKLDDIK